MTARVALVGARGHTGAELVRLIASHRQLALTWAGSRALAGKAVAAHFDIDTTLRFEEPAPQRVADGDYDVVILAMPNGESAPYVEAVSTGRSAGEAPLVVDLSADHRFADHWYYGLPELTASRYAGERLIANPGCYATAMQLAMAPLREHLAATPTCFGVSGYSGAGTRPSRRNDPEVLRDNLLPYALTGHVHEREVGRQLGRPVAFCPHVAGFFRGISLTAVLPLTAPLSAEAALDRYETFYADTDLVKVQMNIPEVHDAAGRPGAVVGGFAASAEEARLVVVCTLDNLLKGAAVQAIQNVNTGLGLAPLEGLLP